MGTLTKKAAIVGVAESDCGIVPDKSQMELIAQATSRALNDAGLKKSDIDGLCCSGIFGLATMEVGEYLNIQPRFTDATHAGGASFEMHVQHAAAAIAAGICHTVLICYAATTYSDRKRGVFLTALNEPTSSMAQFEMPYGGWLTGSYALAAQRHMYQYGTTSEQLAEIAVATRKWASLNPLAMMRTPITIADVIHSPMICSPLHLLDCCLVTDAGGAIIVTSAERARNLRHPPAWILGCGESHSHMGISSMPDLTCTSAKISGEAAFKMAGLTAKDIDVAELYDCFTITVLLQLEDLGFCRKGEGGFFVTGQTTAPGGKFPMNTNGGGLSFTHSGMYGIFLLIEAVRQLRGTCGERQVPGARVVLCNGIGVALSSSSTVILGRD
ncbi:MAG: acetyl-CoA acetyltransferase [Dehalococcoidia bacterium]|nr:acetyl-CoA acetyltransferase [Dehalococcoidia bacterium]